MYLSRKWLLKDVFITKSTYQLWLDRTPPEEVELLRNVRSFTYISVDKMWDEMTYYRIDSLHHYLPSLCRLWSLE